MIIKPSKSQKELEELEELVKRRKNNIFDFLVLLINAMD
jgi:hypothetical protein